MKPEFHLQAFEERKETMLKWGVEIRGIDNSQRVIGDNASKAIAELLSAYLHGSRRVEDGFQLNHAWFKSEKMYERLPEFENKKKIVDKMIDLERSCEQLSYGTPKPAAKSKATLEIFMELEGIIRGMIT